MSDGYSLRPLGEVMRLDIQRTPMFPATTYRLAGVLNAGQGLVAKGELDGGDTEYAAMNVLRVDQVVMRKLTAWEGPITVVPAEFDGFVVSNEFPTFTLGPELVPDWMRHVCRSPRLWAEMKNRVSGTVQRRKRLNPEQLLQIQLPIPPREVQERIVEVLDAVDDQVAALDAEADVLDELWWALGREMAAEVAGDATVPLASFCDISGGLTKNKKDLEQPELVEVPYLRVANVHRRHLNLSEVATIQTTRAKADKLRLHAGDILMNEGGDKDKLGRGHVWEDQIPNCIHQNHVFRVRVTDQRFDPYFVSAWGNTFGREWFETFGTQTTGIASINRATLSRFPVPDIPLSVQQDWAERLGVVVETMNTLRSQASSLRAIRASLVSSLLEQSITINIDSAELEM
ncbi:restriction endonuclease subunit S [Nonomuraea sp. NN258]|uniref:restriction endonuclease subunit S n=1 Tax=Nonomuraea antri TaxID=2730852 RepID=UPI001569091D|nr:restriction endonuclease subunit S [Nonomuraea antri]NRQ37990.1 restriction endonuclease subunit S [Nonomuraea antri]